MFVLIKYLVEYFIKTRCFIKNMPEDEGINLIVATFIKNKVMPAISYTPILPEHVYAGLAKNLEENPDVRKLSDVVLENKPSGNNYIDVFAEMIRWYGKADVKEYAGRMGAELRHFDGAIRCLTGMSAREWIIGYMRMVACDLVAETDLNFKKVGKILGFSQSSFSQFFKAYVKMQPWEYRSLKKHGRKQSFFL